MNSQTSLVARDCRIQEWMQMIQDCKNRPVEMSVDEWCKNHSLTKSNYYYRVRQVRKACLETIPYKTEEQSVVPVPSQLMEEVNAVAPVQDSLSSSFEEPFLDLICHGITLRITERTSDTLLLKTLRILNHVK